MRRMLKLLYSSDTLTTLAVSIILGSNLLCLLGMIYRNSPPSKKGTKWYLDPYQSPLRKGEV
jgi:hypothetical protein